MIHRPSSLPMLAQCPQFSGGGGEYAEQGTIRHGILSAVLKEGDAALIACDNEEDRDAIKWAADHIRLHAPNSDYSLECEVKRHWTGPDFSEREGTPDVVCGNHIFDLKWRRRDYDEQMADYALSLFQLGYSEVIVHILYGATKHVEVLEFNQESAERIVGDVLAKATPDANPTPCDYCGWCAKRLTCAALLERANTVAENREDWQLESYHSSEIISAEEIGKALKLARALGKWCESVEHHAKELARNGTVANGFKVQEKRGNRFISSVTAAYAKAGLAQEDFLSACEIKLAALVEIHAAKSGLKKTAAEREMESRLGEIVQRKSPSTSLVSVKEKD